MASYLEGAASVADYGCGLEWLRDYLKPGVAYYPSDYIARTPSTIVCNFNNWEFPNVVADAGFVSGCLEYLTSPEWFIEQLATHAERHVISYCTLDDNPDIKQRRRNNWVNDLTEQELVQLCEKHKLSLVTVDRTIANNPIFVFQRSSPLSEWGILSYSRSPAGDLHNLGDYIQSLAAAKLAKIEITDAPTVHREHLSEYAGRPLRLVMNGWFAHSCKALPATSKIGVEVVSFHLKRMQCDPDTLKDIVGWLREVGPIGCRDIHTLNLANENGIPAYLSECITPLAGLDFANTEKGNDIIIVDPWLPQRRKWSSVRDVLLAIVSKPLVVLHVARARDAGWTPRAIFDSALFVGIYGRFLSKRVLTRAKWRTHMFSRSSFTTEASILDHAQKLLSEYARAAMVITTRIHCALPCHGMHTPVLFVHSGDGDGRYRGLIEKFATIRIDDNGIARSDDVALVAPNGILDGPIAMGSSFNDDEKREMLGLLERHRGLKTRHRSPSYARWR
jgi:hypothetical protein